MFPAAASFDITAALQPRNELSLEVDLPADVERPGREHLAGGPIGEVRLEIRHAQFVEDLALWTQRQVDRWELVVRGRISGVPHEERLPLVIDAAGQELGCAEVRHGQPFQLSLPADTLAHWPDTSPLEIRLLGAATPLWQTQRDVGLCAVDFDPQRRALTIAGRRVSLPVELRPPRSADDVIAAGFVLSPDAYHRLDRRGVAVVQAIPFHRAATICPLLAHHPSIVAWTAPAADLNSADRPQSFGRPWIPTEIALPAPDHRAGEHP